SEKKKILWSDGLRTAFDGNAIPEREEKEADAILFAFFYFEGLESLEVLFLWGAKSLPDSLLFEGKAPVAKQGSEREKRKRSFCFQFKLSPWLGDSIVGIRLANGSEFFSMHRTSTSLNEEAWP
ncbi:hypothetical protein Salat_2999600, partial [Sesamum alatum]